MRAKPRYWISVLKRHADLGAVEQRIDQVAGRPALRDCNVLMIYPRFQANNFWNYAQTCKLIGAKCPTAPLGLITVAAMLPANWNVRLVNRNSEDVRDEDFAWADMVMTGGMFNQQLDALRLIALAHQHGKPAVVGGPDATSSPHVYEAADFRVLGEVEDVIARFIAAWNADERGGCFTAEKFQIDVSTTPAPRFDLLKFDQYMYIGLQYSRGCPFTCEFCDIIELYGRVPRTKTPPQMLAELQRLYDLGYRGHVDFVDDNLIGNRKSLRIFLPELIAWQEAHDYPFEFSTEASINLADDHDLLQLMRKANFFALFVGIESPDPETLVHTRKKQNTRRNLAESVHRLYSAGMCVTAGFIVGFDTEKVSVADAMVDLIEEAAIPAAMVGLLWALPNTQLTRRLEKEGRLHADYDRWTDESGDQCALSLNFDSLRPERDILLDYRRILERVYEPAAYARRLARLASKLDCFGRAAALAEGNRQRDVPMLELVSSIFRRLPEARDEFWNVLRDCRQSNPAAVRFIVGLMALYVHLGPFSRFVIAEIDRRIGEIDQTARPVAVGRADLTATLT